MGVVIQSQELLMRVGFVGLGLMGIPMARNLMAAGHELLVAGRSRESVAALVEAGAVAGRSVQEIARSVDVFCSCRVTPDHSLATFLGPDGVIEAASDGLLCIDFATIAPATSRRIGAELGARGIGFLDAPISGGPDGAAARTLSIIVGGAKEHFDRARPLLASLGKSVFHMGPVGAGVTTKLCNNTITITTHALIAEAMVLGVKAGIDARALYEVLRSSSAYSRTLERVVANHFLPRRFAAAASITTIMKDLQCAIDAAEEIGAPMLLPKAAMQRFEDAAQAGHGEADIASVILPIEAAAGTKVGPA